MISGKLRLFIILIITATVALYVVLVVIPTQMAKRSYEAAKTIGEDFKKAFQTTPDITVNNTIVLGEQKSAFELSVVSKTFQHQFEWNNTWMNSTKKIWISGSFIAKAGFDLNDNFTITLIDKKAIVNLPPPKILSVESTGEIVYRDENGIWNWVNDLDRSTAANAFIADARKSIEQTGFANEARIEMEKRVRDLLKPYAEEVEIVFTMQEVIRQH